MVRLSFVGDIFPANLSYNRNCGVASLNFDELHRPNYVSLIRGIVGDNSIFIGNLEAPILPKADFSKEMQFAGHPNFLRMLKEAGIRVNLMKKPAPTNKSKEQRIYDYAPDIRERMVFRSDGNRSKDYALFMQNVYSFTMTGKNQHDDAPDSLAGSISMAFFSKPNTVEIFQSPFR